MSEETVQQVQQQKGVDESQYAPFKLVSPRVRNIQGGLQFASTDELDNFIAGSLLAVGEQLGDSSLDVFRSVVADATEQIRKNLRPADRNTIGSLIKVEREFDSGHAYNRVVCVEGIVGKSTCYLNVYRWSRNAGYVIKDDSLLASIAELSEKPRPLKGVDIAFQFASEDPAKKDAKRVAFDFAFLGELFKADAYSSVVMNVPHKTGPSAEFPDSYELVHISQQEKFLDVLPMMVKHSFLREDGGFNFAFSSGDSENMYRLNLVTDLFPSFVSYNPFTQTTGGVISPQKGLVKSYTEGTRIYVELQDGKRKPTLRMFVQPARNEPVFAERAQKLEKVGRDLAERVLACFA